MDVLHSKHERITKPANHSNTTSFAEQGWGSKQTKSSAKLTSYRRLIPYVSFVFLFLLGVVMVNPSVNGRTYALEIDNGENEEEVSTSENELNEEYDISTHTATAALTIDNNAVSSDGSTTITDTVTVAPGAVGYSKEHTIEVNVSDISDYTLTISGPTNLTGPNGATTPITGAGGMTGSSMTDNTWGYGWGDTNTNKESLIYNTLSTTGTNLATIDTTLPTVGSNDGSGNSSNITFSRKLVFAAKFGSTNSNTGQYKANVTLSLVATPATTTYTITYNANGGTSAPGSTTCTVAGAAGTNCTANLTATAATSLTTPTTTQAALTFLGWADSSNAAAAQYSAGSSITLTGNKTLYAVWQLKTQAGFTSITNMQQMTPTICANAKIGDYKDLTDTRDSSKYRVVKFRDGRCWMTDNLKIYNTTIYATDSDFTTPSSIKLLNSVWADFTSANQETYRSYYNTSTATGAGVNTTAYYNWYTATAGAGTSSVTSGSVNTSICPKNWTLPTGGSGGEYQIFAGAESIPNSSAGSTKIQAAPYDFKPVGAINSSSLINGSVSGFWWSSTANNANAYIMHVDSTRADPVTNSTTRYAGRAMRCVARN